MLNVCASAAATTCVKPSRPTDTCSPAKAIPAQTWWYIEFRYGCASAPSHSVNACIFCAHGLLLVLDGVRCVTPSYNSVLRLGERPEKSMFVLPTKRGTARFLSFECMASWTMLVVFGRLGTRCSGPPKSMPATHARCPASHFPQKPRPSLLVLA